LLRGRLLGGRLLDGGLLGGGLLLRRRSRSRLLLSGRLSTSSSLSCDFVGD